MTNPNEYNGWTNYETWLVALWMDNDQGSHDAWLDRARETIATDAGKLCTTLYGDDKSDILREGVHVRVLADVLKDAHDDAMPELGASVWADMLRGAFEDVNWHEIATGLIATVREQKCEAL